MATTVQDRVRASAPYKIYTSKAVAKKALRRAGFTDNSNYDFEFVHQPGGWILPVVKVVSAFDASNIREVYQIAAEMKTNTDPRWGVGEKWVRV